MSDYVIAGLAAFSLVLPPALALLVRIWKKQNPTDGFWTMVVFILLFVLSIGLLCGVVSFGMDRFHFDEEGEIYSWFGIAILIAMSSGAIAEANGIKPD